MSLKRLLAGDELPVEVASSIERAGGTRGFAKRLSQQKRLAAEARYHRALSDEIRLKIMHTLLIGDMCPCILKEVADTSDSKLSYHLRVLESERLISSRRVKNWRVYSITERGRASVADRPG